MYNINQIFLAESVKITLDLEFMEEFCDFLQWLGADMSIKILASLENPTDLVRASAVSSSWRRFSEFITLCIL